MNRLKELSRVPGDAGFDPMVDGLGPTLRLSYRQFGELLRLLDRAADFEEEAGWSTRSLVAMSTILMEKAAQYERSRQNHPSNGHTGGHQS